MPPIKSTGRIARVVRRALVSALPDAYPTIDDPTSGSVVKGGTITVTVSTNRPDRRHTVNVLATDGSGTVFDSQSVTFPGGDSPGTADVTLPAAGGSDVEYFIEVVPTSGPSHRIVVTVLAAGTPLEVGVDTGGNPPGTYPAPLDLALVGLASGGSGVYTFQWLSGTLPLSTTDTLKISLTVGGGTIYTFTCRATDSLGAVATVDVVYTIN
ncbi:MAG: hypothetical protein U0804_08340 [Gemmataceae bacterium]